MSESLYAQKYVSLPLSVCPSPEMVDVVSCTFSTKQHRTVLVIKLRQSTVAIGVVCKVFLTLASSKSLSLVPSLFYPSKRKGLQLRAIHQSIHPTNNTPIHHEIHTSCHCLGAFVRLHKLLYARSGWTKVGVQRSCPS